MIRSVVGALSEILYAAISIFIFSYMLITFIDFHRFIVKFSICTDINLLSTMFVSILGIVTVAKFWSSYLLVAEENEPERKITYIPANRKCI
jgi:hypothetical protein